MSSHSEFQVETKAKGTLTSNVKFVYAPSDDVALEVGTTSPLSGAIGTEETLTVPYDRRSRRGPLDFCSTMRSTERWCPGP